MLSSLVRNGPLEREFSKYEVKKSSMVKDSANELKVRPG